MMIFKKRLLFFLIGAVGYMLIELLWRGRTHWSMAIAGGLAFVFIGIISEKLKEKSIFAKAALSAITITAIELIFGIIFNIILKMNVWDYSDVPLNLLGQICPLFTFLWFMLSIPIIPLAEIINKRLRKESAKGVIL